MRASGMLYGSQHSRTAPLARPLFRVSRILLSRIYIYTYIRAIRHKTRRHHPYIMHGLMLFLFNGLHALYTRLAATPSPSARR